MARSFNGSTDTLTVANQANFRFERTQAQSISAWAFPNLNRTVSTTYSIFSKLDSASPNSGYELHFLYNPGSFANHMAIEFSLVNTFGSNHLAVNNTTTDSTNGVWHHIAVTYDGSSTAAGIAMYVDGITQSTNAAINALSASILNTITPYIGSRNNANSFFNGNYADICQWTVVLTAAEVLALSKGARPYTIRPGSINAYWPLDGFASPEADLSLSKNNGTLTGTALAFGPPVAMFTPRWPQYLTPPPPVLILMPQIVT